MEDYEGSPELDVDLELLSGVSLSSGGSIGFSKPVDTVPFNSSSQLQSVTCSHVQYMRRDLSVRSGESAVMMAWSCVQNYS